MNPNFFNTNINGKLPQSLQLDNTVNRVLSPQQGEMVTYELLKGMIEKALKENKQGNITGDTFEQFITIILKNWEAEAFTVIGVAEQPMGVLWQTATDWSQSIFAKNRLPQSLQGNTSTEKQQQQQQQQLEIYKLIIKHAIENKNNELSEIMYRFARNFLLDSYYLAAIKQLQHHYGQIIPQQLHKAGIKSLKKATLKEVKSKIKEILEKGSFDAYGVVHSIVQACFYDFIDVCNPDFSPEDYSNINFQQLDSNVLHSFKCAMIKNIIKYIIEFELNETKTLKLENPASIIKIWLKNAASDFKLKNAELPLMQDYEKLIETFAMLEKETQKSTNVVAELDIEYNINKALNEVENLSLHSPEFKQSWIRVGNKMPAEAFIKTIKKEIKSNSIKLDNIRLWKLFLGVYICCKDNNHHSTLKKIIKKSEISLQLVLAFKKIIEESQNQPQQQGGITKEEVLTFIKVIEESIVFKNMIEVKPICEWYSDNSPENDFLEYMKNLNEINQDCYYQAQNRVKSNLMYGLNANNNGYQGGLETAYLILYLNEHQQHEKLKELFEMKLLNPQSCKKIAMTLKGKYQQSNNANLGKMLEQLNVVIENEGKKAEFKKPEFWGEKITSAVFEPTPEKGQQGYFSLWGSSVAPQGPEHELTENTGLLKKSDNKGYGSNKGH